jgi:hypothetical protein
VSPTEQHKEGEFKVVKRTKTRVEKKEEDNCKVEYARVQAGTCL